MLRADTSLMASFIEGTETPPDTVKRTNLARNPLHKAYTWYGAMQAAGYGIHFIDNAERGGEPLPGHVAVYVDSDDNESVGSIVDLTIKEQLTPSGGHLPYASYLDAVTSRGLSARQIMNEYSITRDRLLPEATEGQARQLLQRGFLLSCLAQGVANKKLGLKRAPAIQPENEKSYENLRRHIKPLGVEEIYGLGAYAVQTILKHNPDIAPPGRQLAKS